MTADERSMRRALALARRGAGATNPNPMVGAVLVKNGSTIGEGWHGRVGGPHAEVESIRSAGTSTAGSTLYVTLEPCDHQGRTPPCTDAVIAAGITRVVIGATDPDPLVAGRGIEKLERAGIEVVQGVASELCADFYSSYRVHRTLGRPEVTLKAAISLDGKVAAADGSSRWVTSQAARREGHRIRGRMDAICVGAGTVLADDPLLTVRDVEGRPPLRVVMDSNGRIPTDAKVLNGDAPTVVFTTGPSPRLAAAGAEVVAVASDGARVDLDRAMGSLGQRGIMSMLLEGGPTLAASFLSAGLIDRFVFFIAPKLLGGAVSMLDGWEAPSIDKAEELTITRTRKVGEDLMVTAIRKGVG